MKDKSKNTLKGLIENMNEAYKESNRYDYEGEIEEVTEDYNWEEDGSWEAEEEADWEEEAEEESGEGFEFE